MSCADHLSDAQLSFVLTQTLARLSSTGLIRSGADMKVNCIFQGGGANLATLLCAVEALGQLEDEGFLEISGVAGTSAGSIAAACLAHPISNSELILRIISIARANIKDFRVPSTRLWLAWKIFSGKPLISERKLEKVLREVFQIDEKSFNFSDAKYPLFVCASDVRRSKPVIFKNGSEKPLEEAITDSCAIPFVFRAHSSSSSLADGGVMANLLDQSVFEDSSAYTLAFSFCRSGVREYNGSLSYLKSILDSMVDNAIEEARIRILQSGGYVCELPSTFETLGFEEALEKLQFDEFRKDIIDKCKRSIQAGLEDFVGKSALMSYGDRLGQMQGLVDNIFNQIKKSDPYKVVGCVIACEANCLFDSSDARSRNPDLQIKRVRIQPMGENLQFFRIGIARGPDFQLMNEISCRVHNNEGRRLRASFEVATILEDEEPIHRLCVVLEERHKVADGAITVTMTTTHQQGLMEGLKLSGGNEWMRAEAHRDDEISEQDFVLLVPKTFKKLCVSDLRGNLHRCKSQPKTLNSDDANWVVGHAMTDEELEEHQSWLQSDPAFCYVGWRARNVGGRNFSGVLIEQDIGV